MMYASSQCIFVVVGVNYIKRGRINEIIDAFTRFIFKEIRYHTTMPVQG